MRRVVLQWARLTKTKNLIWHFFLIQQSAGTSLMNFTNLSRVNSIKSKLENYLENSQENLLTELTSSLIIS